MTYQNLSDFISYLEERKLLIRVQEQVSLDLEITEIHKRVLESGGPALLFENVITKEGMKSTIPVLVNLFGTVERVAMALSTTPEGLRAIGEKLAILKQPTPPASLKEAVAMLPMLKNILQMKPKIVKKAACQEVILRQDKINLGLLPIQWCWPDEPAPLITWPMIVTKNKEDQYNVGIYRMQVIAKDKTLMRWLKHRGGAEHARNWKDTEQKRMPAAAVIGCDPATLIAAVTPVPDSLSEYDFAGLLRNQKLELVKCVSVPLLVPAHAEIVLEGYIALDEYQDEGPYGDHTGYYNSIERFPTFTITAITMRKKAIYLSTYTGRPPDEPSIIGMALNEIFTPLLKQQFPEIVDFWLPPEGCSYRIAVVSIKKAYPGHAKRIMMGIWSFLRQFTYTKFVIVVDAKINVRDWQDVMWAISTKMDFKRDTVFVENTPMDYLDFASEESELGAKMGFDATDKLSSETKREWGRELAMSKEIEEMVSAKWQSYNI